MRRSRSSPANGSSGAGRSNFREGSVAYGVGVTRFSLFCVVILQNSGEQEVSAWPVAVGTPIPPIDRRLAKKGTPPAPAGAIGPRSHSARALTGGTIHNGEKADGPRAVGRRRR